MKSEHSRLLKASIVTAIVATTCLFLGVLFASEYGWMDSRLAGWRDRGDSGGAQGLILPASLPLTVDERGSSPFVAVAERLLPSVVFIKVSTPVTRGNDRLFGFGGELFGMPDDRFHQSMPEMNSSGSGFIVDDEGYILTNNHVVENASDITVTLSDKSEVDGKIVGTDPITDVAVVKIDAKYCKGRSAPLGNSDDIRVGDWAIAIGNPLGLTQSLTVGVISAKGRINLPIAGSEERNQFQNFIQTDAAINFGNSGGPLVNINGQVMAINTAINANAQSIGFAIPINIARKVYLDLRDHGSVVHGYLGMVPRELTGEMRKALGLDAGVKGVFVDSVQEDTPAAEGDLQQGDVIVEWDGRTIVDESEFRTQVAEAEPGQKVKARILRDGDAKTLDFVLGDRAKAGRGPDRAPAVQPDAQVAGSLGIQVAEVDDYQIRQFRLNGDLVSQSGGVVVVSIGQDSPAHGRLRPGDVITRLGRTPIRVVKDFTSAEKTLTKGSSAVLVYIIRGNQRTTEAIVLGE